MPRRFAAELIGTFCLVFAAAGSVMVDEISGGLVTPLGAGLTSGLVVMAMVYAIGPISGAHINPAVTFGFVLAGDFTLRAAGVYWAAQLAGAALAGGALRLLLGMVAAMGGHSPSGGAPQSLGLEVVLTFIMVFVIMAVAARRDAVGNASGLAIGGTVALCTIIGGPISGGSMNPARSFGPALAGWTWTHHWVYWVGPLIGATIGAASYRWLMPRSPGTNGRLGP